MKKIQQILLFTLFWAGIIYLSEGQIVINGDATICNGSSTTLSVGAAYGTPGSCNSTVNMSNGTTTLTCGNTICFYDSGGANSEYDGSENYVRTFRSNNNYPVVIKFEYVDVESSCDAIYLYDGTNTSGTLLNSGNYYNGLEGMTFTANSGSLTVRFSSDDATILEELFGNDYTGWRAKVYCGSTVNFGGGGGPCTSSVNMSNGSTTVTCGNSVCFYDSGGSNGTYNTEESYVRTFRSSNNSPISITFDMVDVENNYDAIRLYNGTSTSGTLLNSGNIYNGIDGMTFTANSGSLTVSFSSDGSVCYDGWSAVVFCEGANNNYNYTWSTGATTPTITVSPTGTTTYSVTVSGGDIGTLTASITINVVDCGSSGCPSIAPAELGTGLTNIVVDCDVTTVTLAANAVATAATANDYTVMSIPYAPPYNFTDGNRIFADAEDDTWGSPVTLPFAFCYYGNTYTQIVPGANSVATFNTSVAGDYCTWSYSESLPSSSLFTNTIFACYRDIYPYYYSGDGIYEGVLGTYPCRSYVLSFNNIALYSCYDVRTFTSQIVLYEGTNIIDIYLRDAPTCTGWNSGNGLIGIQNSTGTAAVVPPGRNTGAWTTTHEAWRFIPVGEPVYTVTWYQGSDISGPVIGTGDVITVTPPGTTDYTARLQYTACNGNTFDIVNTCHVTMNNDAPPITVTASPNYICANGTSTLSVSAPGATSYQWSTGATTASTTVSPTEASTTYTVTVGYDNGCHTVGSVTVQMEPALVAGTLSSDQTICSGGAAQPLSVSGSAGGADCYYVWQQSSDGVTFTDIADAGNSSTYSPGTLPQRTCYRAGYVSPNCGTVYTNTVCIAIGAPYRIEIEGVVCYGVPYTGNGFNIPASALTVPGVHTDSISLQTAEGCDSIVVLHLTVLPPVTATEERTIVENELPYTWNGVVFNSAGTQTAVLTGPDGCDSTVTMILHVDPNITVGIDTTVCDNALPLQWQGVTFTAEGTQSVVYPSSTGSDSTVNLTLHVIPPVFVTVRDGVCQNEPYSGYGFTVTAEETAEPGLVERSQLYFTALGCDSTVTLKLTVYPNYNHRFELVVCDSMVWNGQVYHQTGVYTQQFTSAHGCDSTVTKDVEVVNTALELVNHTSDFCEDFKADLEVYTELEHIRWSTGEENVRNIVATHAGAYVVTANTAHCEAYDRVVIPACDFNLYIPNAITPSNEDGNNDVFFLPDGMLSQIETFEIRIFDRWGRMVYQSTSPYFRWDGREKGKLRVPNTYAYYIKLSVYGGGDYLYKGIITVL